jgi:hypothetical protein
MEPRLKTNHDVERKVWATPVLRSLRHLSGARTGSFTTNFETTFSGAIGGTYVPPPS